MEQTIDTQAVWAIDKAHTSINFSISHFMIAKVTGHFADFAGTLTAPTEGFDGAALTLTIQAASISTNEANRDNHLRTPDFFDVASHPEIRFVSRSFVGKGSNQYAVEGLLTVNGIEKPIALSATYNGQFVHPMYQTTIAVFEVSGEVGRPDFNIGNAYPAAVLGETVRLMGALELILQ